MPTRIALLATAAALAVVPALAQQSTSPSQPGQSAQPSQQEQKSAQPSQQGQSAQPSQQEQKSAQPGQQTEPARPDQPKAAESGKQMTEKFVDAQSSDQWLGSTLIGLNVKGAGDESIGSVSDLLVEEDGTVVAAVIGVGGFLGIGQKNVAVSFELLEVSRSPEGDEQATLQLTKAELENAPEFKQYEPPKPAASRPGGETSGMTKKPGGGM